MPWDIFVKVSHIVGTVLGVGGATFAEVFYLKASQEEVENQVAVGYQRLVYRVLRIGMILLVLSGFGYFLLLRFEGHAQHILTPRILFKLLLTLLILGNALLMQTRKIPLWLGSALSLTSWYAALVLGAWRGLSAGFWEITLGYVIAVAVVATAQSLIRKIIGAKT